jgi:Family of unknown function (DUF6331)
MKNKNDINIAENLWIDWIEFDYKKSNPKDIDDLLEPTIKLWNRLEVHCIAECCGIHAFSFRREDIKNAVADLDQVYYIDEFKTLKFKISNLDTYELMSSRINNLFHKNVFLKLIGHISEQIKT